MTSQDLTSEARTAHERTSAQLECRAGGRFLALPISEYPCWGRPHNSGLDGVRVSAPPQWREGPETGVRIIITRLERAELEGPINPGLRLGLPISQVRAEVPVFTDSRERLTVSLPTGGADVAYLFPERLSTVIVDSDGPGSFTVWGSDDSATFSAGYLTFEITGFTDDTHLFTAITLDKPRTVP